VATASTREGGREQGWGGRVNRREPLINVVNLNKPKVLKVSTRNHRLGPKGKGSGIGALQSPIVDVALPAKRRNLTHSNQVLSENVVNP
jgi:hypothetical protein